MPVTNTYRCLTIVRTMPDINRTRLATAICCVGVLATGWSLENSAFDLAIAAALCIASSSYAASERTSRVKAAQLFLLNAALLVLVAALLRVMLAKLGWRFPLSA